MTLKERYQALADGRKLCSANICSRYVHVDNGELKHHNGSRAHVDFTVGDWTIYEEQKDLDLKIKEAEHDLEDFLDNGMALSATCKISNLIDLKIKKVQLK